MRLIHKKCAAARLFVAQFAVVIGFSLALAACKPATEAETKAPNDERADAHRGGQTDRRCGDEGRLQTELYGAIEAQLEWDKYALECAGMPRPEGRGARLRFAGNLHGDARRIAIIIAIPDLVRNTRGEEYRSIVTLIDEDNARFFSTLDLDNCLTDISELLKLDVGGDRYSIGGILYCVKPLPEVNGDSSVLIPELRFSGLLDWSTS